MIVGNYSKDRMSDLVSLDLEPKGPEAPPASSSSFSLGSGVWYRTSVFKGIAIIIFLVVMSFPHPEWLQTILAHPVGGIAFAWGVGVALVPELEWWIVGLGVLSGYLLLVLSGIIETNIETKRSSKKEKEKEEAKETKKKSKEDETDIEDVQEQESEQEQEQESFYGMNQSYSSGPMAFNLV